MPKKSSQKFKYLENEKSFYDEIKRIFHHFWKATNDGNKNFFLKGEIPTLTDIASSTYELEYNFFITNIICNGTITLLYHFYVSLRLCPNLSLADLGTQTRERGKIKSNSASWSVSFSDSNVCIVPFSLLYLDCST